LTTRTANELDSILDELEKRTDSTATDLPARFAAGIARIFQLQTDEVAIIEILPPGRMMRFVLPEKLATTGTIPLNSSSALAARTARLRRTGFVNNFSSLPHATVFEGVPLGRRPEEWIQKILSAPILRDNRVIGVVQLCRKGETQAAAGPDFTAEDIAQLQELGDMLARFLTLARPS
jgi:GAF domain-containing protein